MFLNTPLPYKRYKKISETTYFVDKTCILNDILGCMEEEIQYICITRPRRFGKTIMANMLGAFLGKSWNSSLIFDHLKIAKSEKYQKYLNQYDLIYIDFSRLPENCTSYQQYISRIITGLKNDLIDAYPDYELKSETAVWDMLAAISDQSDQQFVFIMDEWDAVFHMPFITETDKAEYILFLKTLLKDQDYVALAYITGIFPISKYSSGSELNMFMEFKMTSMETFGEYFGFTDAEVDILYKKYMQICKNPQVSRQGLQEWYDGYFTVAGKRLYNPRSVVMALRFNQLSNYWTSSGPYDEIFYYIRNDIDQIKNDLALMVSGEGIEAKVDEFAASAMELKSRNQICSAIVNLVYLSARNKYRIEREDKAGKGYVDFIFYPWNVTDPCIILELKVDSSPEEAIQQIKDKDYILRFQGKLRETSKYTGKILGVGISYDKETKEHQCKIEMLSNHS